MKGQKRRLTGLWLAVAFALAPQLSSAEAQPLPIGKPLELSVPGDRNLRVTHADLDGPASRAAIVYLPGMCGNPKAADPWVDLAAARATVIVVRANIPCKDRPGYRWPRDVNLIQERIARALRRVKSERGGQLDTSSATLIGYSQGAHRAERLAERFPQKYPTLVLGGPPTAPEVQRLFRARRVAVLGGELENSDHMQRGTSALQAANLQARFFLLPQAHHGSYGPSGRAVMKDVLSWLYARQGSSATASKGRR